MLWDVVALVSQCALGIGVVSAGGRVSDCLRRIEEEDFPAGSVSEYRQGGRAAASKIILQVISVASNREADT